MRKVIVLAVVVLAVLLLTAASPSQAQAAGPSYVIVQPGQSLTSIASTYGISTWALASANGLWNPNLIYVGQLLVIPGAWSNWCGYGASCYRPYQNPYPFPFPYHLSQMYPQPRPTYGCYYWVRYGDTMSSIAWRYGGNAWTIARANGIYNLNWIYAGQRLFIPGCN